jgi:hypothetical protein
MSGNYRRRHLTWVRNGAAWVVRQGGTELACVVPDEKHPGMWRVRSTPICGVSRRAVPATSSSARSPMRFARLGRKSTRPTIGLTMSPTGRGNEAQVFAKSITPVAFPMCMSKAILPARPVVASALPPTCRGYAGHERVVIANLEDDDADA